MVEEMIETIEEKEIKFSQSPVSDIINNVWRGPVEEPPVIRKERKRKTIEPKAQEAPRIQEPTPQVEVQPVTLQMSGEQLLAIFDGLKLLLAKLASTDPQPLRAIYVTTGLIQGLEEPVKAKLREMMGAPPIQQHEG